MTFVNGVAARIVEQHPDELTTEFTKVDRGDRIYVDVNRNAPAQHAVTPYSLRAKPGAPVAMPIEWSEVEDKKLTPQRYTLADAPRVIGERGDPWKGMRKAAKSLKKAIVAVS
jgi:bifunctional non-homologous end joining protein LigD